jgi:hypothetical protein
VYPHQSPKEIEKTYLNKTKTITQIFHQQIKLRKKISSKQKKVVMTIWLSSHHLKAKQKNSNH